MKEKNNKKNSLQSGANVAKKSGKVVEKNSGNKNTKSTKNSIANNSKATTKKTAKSASKNSKKQSNKKNDDSSVKAQNKGKNKVQKNKNNTIKTIDNLNVNEKNLVDRMKAKSAKKPKQKITKKPSAKTQGLANKIKQQNIKEIEKIKNTTKVKQDSNLNRFIGNKASKKSRDVNGIIKNTRIVVGIASKNSDVNFNSNVVGKKSSLKFVTSKILITFSVVCLVLFISSLVFCFYITKHFKFVAENPPYTITKTISLQLQENSASNFASITVPKNIVRGVELSQKVSVYVNVLQNSQVVRCKSFFTTGSGDVLTHKILFNDDWLVHTDGYAYYTKILEGGELVNAIKGVEIPSEFEKDIKSKMQHIITINFETISVNNQLLEEFWKTAPENFLL